ncbi:MAG TPA: hypothetical protein VF456_22465 [Vicinamibacterales bacterium]
MAEPIHWSRNPELWMFRAKRLKLRTVIEQSRSDRLRSEREYIEREYHRLGARFTQLVEDGWFAKRKKDERAMQRLAVQIAAFYQDIGVVESRVDLLLGQVAAFDMRLRKDS